LVQSLRSASALVAGDLQRIELAVKRAGYPVRSHAALKSAIACSRHSLDHAGIAAPAP